MGEKTFILFLCYLHSLTNILINVKSVSLHQIYLQTWLREENFIKIERLQYTLQLLSSPTQVKHVSSKRLEESGSHRFLRFSCYLLFRIYCFLQRREFGMKPLSPYLLGRISGPLAIVDSVKNVDTF